MAAVSGSLFRRILFWAHLCAGVLAGVFILLMSATGVLLTYEHQMVERATRANRVELPASTAALDADGLALAARTALPGGRGRIDLVFDADPRMPVTASRGRESVLLDPVTGGIVEDAANGKRQFFRVVENWHRWLGGEPRSTRASLLDYANLLFLFIVISGVYIWLPHVMRWRNWRGLMFFQKKYVNAKVRDFNWHHVFSFWMLIPLFVISLSGVVISFDWANKALYAAYGEEAPQRRGPPGASPAPAAASGLRDGATDAANDVGPRATLEALRLAATAQVSSWQRMTLPVEAGGPSIDVAFELPSSERRPPRRTVTLNTADASVTRVSQAQGAAPQTAGQKARTWMRFAHTGEQYGVIGQTVAGVASLAACVLVYTGLALAYRRLIRPLLRRA